MSHTTHRIRHPYHLKKTYYSWRLRILAHEHTGRRAHHQHTSYPMVALMLMVAGVILARSTVGVYAATSGSDYLNVSAVVSGPVPSDGSTIETPIEGRDFTATPIDVTGTCPVSSYVQLFRNNYPSGTALCTASGTYVISTGLFDGANDLVVKTYNYAMQPGPDSETRRVTYTPPVVVVPPVQGTDTTGSGGSQPGTTGGQPSSGSSTTTPRPAPTAPLLLRNDYQFRGYYINEPASWTVDVSGGTAPYSISVDWGDGKTDLYTSTKADTLTLSHTYDSVGPGGNYPVIVSASDAAGNKTTLQILALIIDPQTGSGGTTTPGKTPAGGLLGGLTSSGMLRVVAVAWTAFGAVCLTVLAFWLGELRELRIIRERFRMSKKI